MSAKGWQGRELQSSQLAQKLQEAEAALEQQGIDQRREQASSQVPHDARLELPLALTLLSVQYSSYISPEATGSCVGAAGHRPAPRTVELARKCLMLPGLYGALPTLAILYVLSPFLQSALAIPFISALVDLY